MEQTAPQKNAAIQTMPARGSVKMWQIPRLSTDKSSGFLIYLILPKDWYIRTNTLQFFLYLPAFLGIILLLVCKFVNRGLDKLYSFKYGEMWYENTVSPAASTDFKKIWPAFAPHIIKNKSRPVSTTPPLPPVHPLPVTLPQMHTPRFCLFR